MVHANLIANCPVTQKDIFNAYALFGQNLPGLRGKTVRCKPEHVEMDNVQIPLSLIKMNNFVTLTADVILVNNYPFVVTFG